MLTVLKLHAVPVGGAPSVDLIGDEVRADEVAHAELHFTYITSNHKKSIGLYGTEMFIFLH